jgi:DMSO/TMAO reductase YedYZ heme-binding membrane subunit
LNKQAILGLLALLMLVALVATSFDKAIKSMGVWWFRLHRLIYAAAFLALLHAFMIGAHATSIGPLMVIIALAVALIILHICVALGRPKTSWWQWLTIALAAMLLIAISNYGVQRYVERIIIINGHTHR